MTVLWLGVGAACALCTAVLAVSIWALYERAGWPGWTALVPGVNAYVWQRITGGSVWWIPLLCVPVVALLPMVVMSIGMARRFGKGAAYGVAIALGGVVFLPLLVLSGAEYIEDDAGTLY